jgi:hypothetical protein
LMVALQCGSQGYAFAWDRKTNIIDWCCHSDVVTRGILLSETERHFGIFIWPGRENHYSCWTVFWLIGTLHFSFDLTERYFQHQRTYHNTENYQSVWHQT